MPTQLRISRNGSIGLEFFDEGQKVEIPDRFAGWANLYKGFGLQTSGNRIVLSKSRFLRELPSIRSLRDELGLEVTLDEEASRLIEDFRNQRREFQSGLLGMPRAQSFAPDQVVTILQAREFKRATSLRDHQVRAINEMVSLSHFANFSVPGAGKTTVMLAVHELEKSRHPDLRLLVLAPKNAMGAWDLEAGECLNLQSPILRLGGGAAGVAKQLATRPWAAMMTYELLRSSFEVVIDYLEHNKVHLVLDESHRAKAGSESMQGAAVLEIAPSAFRRDILSGTPMPQRISDICAQLSFLWPFERFCGGLIQESAPEALQETNRVIRPLFTRTTKKELGLPPIEKAAFAPIAMSPHQSLSYRMLRAEASKRFQTREMAASDRVRTLGKQVTTLLQIASNPQLAYSRLNEDASAHDYPEFLEVLRKAAEEEESNKFIELERLVEQILSNPDEKVVIWSSFVGTIKEIERRFKRFGALSIHGGVKTGSDQDIDFREARVKRFNGDPRHRVMVANPAAGGEGISLHHACHNAIYFDRSFNAAQYLQSVDRIHRLGLPEGTVTRLYILESAESVDEIVSTRLSEKIRAMETVLNDFGIEPIALDVEEDYEENEAGIDAMDEAALLAHLLGD